MIPLNRNTVFFGIAASLSMLCYFYLGYFFNRADFYELLTLYTFLFLAYLLFIGNKSTWSSSSLFYVGIAFRFILILCIPFLSDDFYRFIWDGQLMLNGENPFEFLPIDYQGQMPQKELLLSNMNSPNYYSVYPPILQYVFGLSVLFQTQSLLSSIVVMRLIIILSDIGSFFLLKKILGRLGMKESKAFLYFLNPLIIIELTANLHFEALMIFSLLAAIYLLIRSKVVGSAAFWSMAFLVKMIPLFFLPLLLRKLHWKGIFVFALSFIATLLIVSAPIIDSTSLANIKSSLDLYFENFEFNASIYYILRWLGFQLSGYNMIGVIGPLLGVISFVVLLYFLLIKSQSSWKLALRNMLFAVTAYYLLALIIHPWYISTLLALACFGSYLYPVLWSYLIVFSYSAYTQEVVEESPIFLLLEYLPLFILIIYELRKRDGIIHFLENENISILKRKILK